MTEIEFLREQLSNTNECLKQVTMVVANALPHTQQEIAGIFSEWNRIGSEITSEFRKETN